MFSFTLYALRSTLYVVMAFGLWGCGDGSRLRVVVYVSLDKHLSRPILDAFERKTGIKVLEQTDNEANKGLGLVKRVIAEADAGNVRCDVYWNNEFLQSVRLKNLGLTAPYVSAAAEGIPPAFRDSEGHWAGFAARARVLIVNTEKVPPGKTPRSIEDLADPAWKSRTCIARPNFGTTATHGAVLFALDGDAKAQDFFKRLLANDVGILLGNSTVRDMVARGRYAFGLTDTDDAYGAISRGDPVKMVFPDQDGRGTLVIPNTVCLMKGAPHPEAAKKLIDYLLSPEVEEALARAAGRQFPVRRGVKVPDGHRTLESIKAVEVDYGKVLDAFDRSSKWFRDHFRK